MMTDIDHPQRYALVNELHARPSPRLSAPCEAVYLAFKEPRDAASRDRARDRAHLAALTGEAVGDDATHDMRQMGGAVIRWESYAEFVSYTAFRDGLTQPPFDPAQAAIFPEDWQAVAPGKRLASVLVRVEDMPEDPGAVDARISDWFSADSLTAATAIDGAAIIATDFRIDPAGHMRFAVFVRPGTGPGRIGRIVQRLLEIETYRAMAMLGLKRARDVTARLNAIEPELAALVEHMADQSRPSEATLHDLLGISARLESLAMQLSFRFGATPAYEAIVHDRIRGLREERFAGRQTFDEFMSRRFEPAMRTVRSAERRLQAMIERAARAGELLGTRVDVERAAQNQNLLESMDARADLQLRLQETVEGLSVVAISYYAVSLAGYLLYPLAKPLHISKEVMLAGIVPLVVICVWLMVRHIKNRIH
ncbi:DUF3422 family protein [Paracoccus sp. p4-l81]|uniref:DUF3422 family protein n=1 Tax=unclassified Paracoccus (in: a-proteobacteria) TaxID=2688777 RepID=UPI0035BA766E